MGGTGLETHGGAHVPILVYFEATSIRVADIWGGKALGFWATKRGMIG